MRQSGSDLETEPLFMVQSFLRKAPASSASDNAQLLAGADQRKSVVFLLTYAQAAATTDEEREILSLTLDLVDDASLHLFIRHTPSHEFPI